MNAFKAYDIRGVYGRDFNAKDAYRIGFFLPKLLSADKVLVGYDARESSPEIYDVLCRGITDAGADVHSLGYATTPMVYYGTAKFGFPASVQITASHNPREYNGFKISKDKALPVGSDSGLQELEAMVKHETPVPSVRKGSIRSFSLIDEYVEFMKARLSVLGSRSPDSGLAGDRVLSLGIDCSNGMASLIARRVFGDSPLYLYDTIDGTFPNHEPNPLDEKNTEDLKKLVRTKRLDAGIIFDGDGDRVMFVDESGRFISPDLIIAFLAHHFLKNGPGNVLHDIRTSRSVIEFIKEMGGTPYMWKVGHAFAKRKLKEISGVYGGELAGHYYFRDFFNCDSGMLAAVLVVSILSGFKAENRTFSGLIKGIQRYAFSGEMNFRVEKKEEAMDRLKAVFAGTGKQTAFYDFDGYRMEFEDWWFNVRPSNTEPYLRLVVEAENDEQLGKKVTEVRNVLAAYGEPA